jgi:Tol biopolymer transport system component
MSPNGLRAGTYFCTFLLATACSTAPRLPDYRIALVPARKGQHGIFVMKADRTGGKLLVTDEAAQLRHSSWSPDGKKIAFFSYRTADKEIERRFHIPSHYPLYVMGAGGNNQRRLLDFPVSSFGWSPDGRKMFVISAYEDPEAEDREVMAGKKSPSSAIYLLDLDTGNHPRITSLGQNCAASWSPDGTRLAFSSGSNQETQIYVASLDGRYVRQITDSSTLNIRPSWSPTGKSIAYLAVPTAAAPEGEGGVYVMDADGNKKRKVSELPAYEVSWAPDGKQLLIQASGGLFLWSINSEKPVGLVVEGDRPLDAVFTPDGANIMYRSNHEGEWHLYIAGLGGRKGGRLTGQLSAASFCLSPLLSRN